MERARPDKRPGGTGGAEAFSAEAEGLVRCGGSVREGETFAFGAGISVTVLESGPFGQRRVRLAWQGDLAKAFAATGHIPLPPYIKRADGEEDLSRYQTVYARSDKTGSVAAPTAGLHFTPAMREKLADRGFEWAEVTLYVGYGTFSPVRCEDIRSHRMHREYVEVPEATAAAIARAKAQGRPVVAVGTTSVRTLEGVAELCGRVQPYTGWDGYLSLSRQELPRGGCGADQFSSAGILPAHAGFGLCRARAHAGGLCRSRDQGLPLFFLRGRHAH